MNRLFSLNLSRSLIRCVGAKAETSQFLQGMITNDMNHFDSGSPCIYALFLNKGGRVLYDSIIYKAPAPDQDKEAFLIECDSSIASNLAKHLKLYRVRRKIDITVSEEHDVWFLQGSAKDIKTSENLSVSADPRLKNFGHRIVSTKSLNIKQVLESVEEGSLEDYTTHRYQHGICEGVVDLIPEKSLPLESNCDYMHGVSSTKDATSDKS
jgi:transferase CAF17, mitochondrial